MKEELVALEELQALDLEVLEYSKQLKEIPENLKAMRSDVAHVGEILEREKQRLTEAEQWHKDSEKEASLQSEMLGKSKGKLQASRNEKENKAAQREIDAMRKNIQDREEDTIKLIEAIERYRAAVDKHATEFAELERQLAEAEAEGKAQMAAVEAKIAETTARRAELASRVPAPTYRLYERIHKRLGRAVVQAENGTCSGCHLDLLPQTYIEVQRGNKLYQCPNCFRILIYKEKPNPDAAAEE